MVDCLEYGFVFAIGDVFSGSETPMIRDEIPDLSACVPNE